MIVDLNPLPFTTALNLIKWCIENNIDANNCRILLAAMHTIPVPALDWTITIPGQYDSFVILKFGGRHD